MNKIIRGFIRRYFPLTHKKIKFRNLDRLHVEQLKSGRIFEPELLLLKDFIKQGDVVFDVGANAGEYTYVFEKLAGAAYVHSFEPIPKLFTELRRLFPKVNLHKIALSDKEEITQFKIPIIDGSKFETRGKLDIDYLEPGEVSSELIEVECKTLDLFVTQNNIERLDFIKIDVEGHELKVLKGADKCIKQFRPIMLVEIEQRHHPFAINKIFDHIKSLGYQIQFYDLNSLQLKSISEVNIVSDQDYRKIKTSDYINNFWCFPNTSASSYLEEARSHSSSHL